MRANLPTGRLTRATPGVSTRGIWIDAAIALVCVLPLLLTAHLPLSDLPNHLARQFILQDWASSQALQTSYLIHWRLVPNLALDPLVLGARLIMSIDAAVRLFCIITVLLLFLGTRLVNRILSNQMSRAYRIAPLLCYGGPFQLGFLNYCFGVGLALLLFGSYLRIRGRSNLAVTIFLLISGIAVLLTRISHKSQVHRGSE